MQYTKEELVRMHTITTVGTSYRKKFVNLQVMEFELVGRDVQLVPYIVTFVFDGAFIVDERWFSNIYDAHVVKDAEGTKVMWLDFDEVGNAITLEKRPVVEGLLMEVMFDNCPAKWTTSERRDKVSTLMKTMKNMDVTFLPEWTFDEVFEIGGPLMCQRIAEIQQHEEAEQENERVKKRVSQFMQAVADDKGKTPMAPEHAVYTGSSTHSVSRLDLK